MVRIHRFNIIEDIEDLGIIVDKRLIKLYKVIIKKQFFILLSPCRALSVFYQYIIGKVLLEIFYAYILSFI